MLAQLLVPILLALALAGPALAQSQLLKADDAFRLAAARSADGTLTLSWRIAPGTYLYRQSLKATHDGAAVPLTPSPGVEKDDPNFGTVEIYHDAAEAHAAGLPASGQMEVSFQGCADGSICYPTVTRQVDLATLAVTAAPRALPLAAAAATTAPAAESGATGAGTDTLKSWEPSAPRSGGPARAMPGEGVPVAPASAQDGAFALFGGNLSILLAAFFGFGLLLAFTPCIFPMLPILTGILGGTGSKPAPLRGLALSTTYGLAMAAAYGVLGLAAAWSGANLQAALQTPWALGLMASVFLALALSMFGLFDLAMPSALAARLPRSGGGSLLGAAGLGFGSALVVGPCVTPPLAGAMLYAAQTGDAARGGAALFMLGLGMGLPLVVVATFGAQILPRSGPWLLRIKQASGVLFLGVAAYLATRFVPDAFGLALWGALAIGLGVFLGALDQTGPESPGATRLGKATGLITLAYGLTLVVGAAGGAGDPFRPLSFLAPRDGGTTAAVEQETRVSSPAGLKAALAETRGSGHPALVAFTASWCTVCKSNEQVMAEPAVQARLAGLPLILVDVSTYGEGARELMERFSVVGPPTLFLMDAAGDELPGSRHIGALTVADLDGLAGKAGL